MYAVSHTLVTSFTVQETHLINLIQIKYMNSSFVLYITYKVFIQSNYYGHNFNLVTPELNKNYLKTVLKPFYNNLLRIQS